MVNIIFGGIALIIVIFLVVHAIFGPPIRLIQIAENDEQGIEGVPPLITFISQWLLCWFIFGFISSYVSRLIGLDFDTFVLVTVFGGAVLATVAVFLITRAIIKLMRPQAQFRAWWQLKLVSTGPARHFFRG